MMNKDKEYTDEEIKKMADDFFDKTIRQYLPPNIVCSNCGAENCPCNETCINCDCQL